MSYWESLATELKGFKARVSLQEKHKELMARIDLAHETKRKKEKQGNKFFENFGEISSLDGAKSLKF